MVRVSFVTASRIDDDLYHSVLDRNRDLRFRVEIQLRAIGKRDHCRRGTGGDLIARHDGPGWNAICQRRAIDAECTGTGDARNRRR